MFLAEVKAVHADEAYLDKSGRLELNRAGLLAYSHGEYLAAGKKLGTFGYSVKKKAPEQKRAVQRKKATAHRKRTEHKKTSNRKAT